MVAAFDRLSMIIRSHHTWYEELQMMKVSAQRDFKQACNCGYWVAWDPTLHATPLHGGLIEWMLQGPIGVLEHLSAASIANASMVQHMLRELHILSQGVLCSINN